MRLIFWLASALVAYVYAGYPVVLALVTRRRTSTRADDALMPRVSLIIAAHDEEAVLADKLENSLALDYPPERLQIVVASDGSDDRTNAIAAAYAARGVVMHDIRPRGGKTRALNLVIPRTAGDILILSDANTMYRADAVRRLVRHFADPTVGGVSGDVRLIDAADAYASSEGLYYRYERLVQTLESRLGSIVGADGAMYAIRRSVWSRIPETIVVDDFVISMNVACSGLRVIYDREAIATEQGTASSREEFARKARIVAGGLQAMLANQGVPGWRTPWLLWSYVSHKVLRWLMPVMLAAVFLSSAALATSGAFFAVVVGVQIAFYALAALRVSTVPFYFCLVNGAALAGIWRALRNTQAVTWQRTTRLERTR